MLMALASHPDGAVLAHTHSMPKAPAVEHPGAWLAVGLSAPTLDNPHPALHAPHQLAVVVAAFQDVTPLLSDIFNGQRTTTMPSPERLDRVDLADG